MTKMLQPVYLLALAAALSATLFSAEPTDQTPMVNAKLIRPGANAVAGILPVGMCMSSQGFSTDRGVAGQGVTGLTGFYACAIHPRIALQLVPVHWIDHAAGSGYGDTSVGVKLLLFRENGPLPMISTAYAGKILHVNRSITSASPDHKVTLYADKRVGRGRLSTNYMARWIGGKDGYAVAHTGSVGLLHPIRGRVGIALQTYEVFAPTGRTHGAVSAATYHLTPGCSVHLGVEHRFRPSQVETSVVWGITTVMRLWKPKQ